MSDNQFVKTSLCSVMTLVSAWAVSSSAVAYQPAGKFKTEEQARKYCPNDQVVRVDLTTRRFYAKGHFCMAWSAAPLLSACAKHCRKATCQVKAAVMAVG